MSAYNEMYNQIMIVMNWISKFDTAAVDDAIVKSSQVKLLSLDLTEDSENARHLSRQPSKQSKWKKIQ